MGDCRAQEAGATAFHAGVAGVGTLIALGFGGPIGGLIGITMAMQSAGAAASASNDVGSVINKYNTTCNEIENTKTLSKQLDELATQIEKDQQINAGTEKNIAGIIDDYNGKIKALTNRRREFRVKEFTNIAIDIFIVFAMIVIIINKKALS